MKNGVAIADIKANGFLDVANTIHCIVLWSSENGWEYYHDDLRVSPRSGNIVRGIIALQSHDRVVFHNGAGYDLPMMRKIYPKTSNLSDLNEKLYDTLIMSQARYPERNLHKLESWGEEFGIPKPPHEDWENFSKDMLTRCEQDVKITKKLYEKLIVEADEEVWKEARILEQKVLAIHTNQANYGVRLNIQKAISIYHEMEDKRNILISKITEEAPWKCMIPGVAKMRQSEHRQDMQTLPCVGKAGIKPFKKDGDLTVNTKKYFEGSDSRVEGMYSKVSFSPMNLNSSDEVKEYLLTLGWKPTEWNYSTATGRKVRTSPKLTEDSYSSIPPGLGEDIAQYNMLTHRSHFIFNPSSKGGAKGALVNVNQKTGRVPADAITLGTPTARYRHMGTVCNPPRVTTTYGKEVRSLFCVPEGWFLTGLDLKSIEARILAHYIMVYPGGPEIAEIILSPSKTEDFHSYNARMWDVDRDTAKSGYYALIFGCYPNKLASTLGKPTKEGQKLFDKFWEVNKPIKLLNDDLEKAYDRNNGKIRGLDGRWLYIREKRKLLNSLLQGGAAVIFKRWMVLCDQKIKGYDLTEDVRQVIAYHDELQFESSCNEGVTRGVAGVFSKLALVAGEYYDLKVKTPADFKLGSSWADTH